MEAAVRASLNNWNTPIVKQFFITKSLQKLAVGRQTTIAEASIFKEVRPFLLTACKGGQQNLKNDCPHTKISPYLRQHLEDTALLYESDYFKCFLKKFSEPSKGHLRSLWVSEWMSNWRYVHWECIHVSERVGKRGNGFRRRSCCVWYKAYGRMFIFDKHIQGRFRCITVSEITKLPH